MLEERVCVGGVAMGSCVIVWKGVLVKMSCSVDRSGV